MLGHAALERREIHVGQGEIRLACRDPGLRDPGLAGAGADRDRQPRRRGRYQRRGQRRVSPRPLSVRPGAQHLDARRAARLELLVGDGSHARGFGRRVGQQARALLRLPEVQPRQRRVPARLAAGRLDLQPRGLGVRAGGRDGRRALAEEGHRQADARSEARRLARGRQRQRRIGERAGDVDLGAGDVLPSPRERQSGARATAAARAPASEIRPTRSAVAAGPGAAPAAAGDPSTTAASTSVARGPPRMHVAIVNRRA